MACFTIKACSLSSASGLSPVGSPFSMQHSNLSKMLIKQGLTLLKPSAALGVMFKLLAVL